jgi:hypothetical protein
LRKKRRAEERQQGYRPAAASLAGEKGWSWYLHDLGDKAKRLRAVETAAEKKLSCNESVAWFSDIILI